MGNLARCLKRLNITGVEADRIRAMAQDYRQDGLSGREANIRAVQDLIADTQTELQGVLAQLPGAVRQQVRLPSMRRPRQAVREQQSLYGKRELPGWLKDLTEESYQTTFGPMLGNRLPELNLARRLYGQAKEQQTFQDFISDMAHGQGQAARLMKRENSQQRESSAEEPFELTPPPTTTRKGKAAKAEQAELFSGSETMEVGAAPIIGREVTPEEAPLFSKTAQEEGPEQTAMFEAQTGYRRTIPQTETPEFKRWFRDSKVVDKDGKPRVVYHATPAQFEEFIPGGPDLPRPYSEKEGLDADFRGRAIWASGNPNNLPAAHNIRREGNRHFGPGRYTTGTNVIPLYLSMQRPIVYDSDTREWSRSVYGSEFPFMLSDETIQKLKEDGYDGIIADIRDDGSEMEYVVFSPTQIKSALANQGTFDPNDHSILREPAYHGTANVWQPEPGFPHGRPRLDKIGTGEGAQAYGWGWYSAEAESTATFYRDSLGYKDIVRGFLGIIDQEAESDEVMEVVEQGVFSSNQERLLKALNNDDWLGFDYPAQAITAVFKNKDFAERWDASPELVEAVKNYSTIYKLDIPDAVLPKLLDWDKPLEEQSEYVLDTLKKNLPWLDGILKAKREERENTRSSINPPPPIRGSELYGMLGGLIHKKRASLTLGDFGIPGLKYLDGMSRGKGEGTRNYVIWDQKVLDQIALLERNGQALEAIQAMQAKRAAYGPTKKTGASDYRNVPDSLMGFSKPESGTQKGFSEHPSYTHIEKVRVTFPDGDTMIEAMDGRNANHALERARRNWEGAKIDGLGQITKEEADALDPQTGAPNDQTSQRPEVARGRDTRQTPAVSADQGQRGAVRPPPGAGGGITTELGIAQDFANTGRVDLTGRSITSKEELADIASLVFRDRNVEVLNVILLKDGQYVNHMAVTSRRPGLVAPFVGPAQFSRFIGKIQAKMAKTGADQWMLVHNHPSANPEPSVEDIGMTRNMENRIPGFRGHVVINHTKYGYIAPLKPDESNFEDSELHDLKTPGKDLRADQLGHPLFNMKIADADSVAHLGQAVSTKEGRAALVLGTRQEDGDFNRTVGIQTVPVNFLKTADFPGYVRNATRAFGGRNAFVYLPKPDRILQAKLAVLVSDGVLRDAVIEHGGARESLAKYGLQPNRGLSEQGDTAQRIARQSRFLQEPDTVYGPPPPTQAPPTSRQQDFGPPPTWTADEPTGLDDFIRKYQDQHIDTRKVVSAIDRAQLALGNAAQKVPDVLNPTYYIDTMAGKQDAMSTQFEEKELQPLIDDLARHNLTAEDLNEYLMAITAEEANAYFRELNPQDEQGDLFGDFDNTALSGMSNAEAYRVLAQANREVLQPLADRVFAMLKKTRQLMVQYGEESQETIDEWETLNPHYIPRRREGFQDEKHEIGRPQGLAVVGRTVKTALGSQRNVVDILGHVAHHRQKVIARGERMKPILAMAAMFTKYHNADFVRITKPLTFEYLDPATGLTQTITQPHSPRPMKRVLDKKTRTVKWVPVVSDFYDDHVVPFKIKGKQYGLVFDKNHPRAVAMARALKGLDAPTLGGLTKTVAVATRYIAAMNTQYSPVFGPWNFARDTLFAAATLENTSLKGEQWGIMRSAFGNLKAIYQLERARRRGQAGDTEFAGRFNRFGMAGGMTGYQNLYQTGEEHSENIEKLLNPSRWRQGFDKAGLKAVSAWVQDYNAAFENAVRLAVFERALAKGMPVVKAASMAKDVTVNFNRRGLNNAQLGAWYAFFNVTMQSSERVITTMFEKGTYGKLTPAGKKILYGGLLAGSMQAVGLALMGFDEDEPPEWIRQRNFLIPAPGTNKGYIAIPMPLGFNIFPNIGRLATELVLYGDPRGKFWKLIDSVYGVADPLGGSGSFFQEVSPTALDPMVALLENKDWTGRSIYREDFLPTKPTTGESRANATAGQWAIWLSRATNYAFGGSEYTPGFIGDKPFSPPPEAFEYLFSQALGGPGREATKVLRLAKAAQRDEPMELYDVPFLGRLVGTASGKANTWEKWRKNMMTLHKLDLELKGRKGDSKAIAEFRNEHPLAKNIFYGRHTETKIRKLLKQRRDLQRQEDTPANRDRRRRLDDRLQTILTKFNERMDQRGAN